MSTMPAHVAFSGKRDGSPASDSAQKSRLSDNSLEVRL
jgi:hypothetical protein